MWPTQVWRFGYPSHRNPCGRRGLGLCNGQNFLAGVVGKLSGVLIFDRNFGADAGLSRRG